MIPVKTFFRTGISELISCGHLNLTVVELGHLLSNLLSLTQIYVASEWGMNRGMQNRRSVPFIRQIRRSAKSFV